MSNPLPIAILVVYIILILPVTFCLIKHGRSGILGWLAFQVLCGLRIVGSIIEIHQNDNHSTNTTATLILNSVGLSPLLLGALGVLHEARTAGNLKINTKLEWFKVLNFHGLVVVSMVLVIIGIVHEIDNKTTTPPPISKVGVVLLLLSWLILAVWVYFSLQQRREQPYTIVPLQMQAYKGPSPQAQTNELREPPYLQQRKSTSSHTPTHAEATILLHAIVLSMPFIACRDSYTALYTFITSTSFKSSQTAKIILSVVPEIIVTAIMAAAGVRTRQIAKLRKLGRH